MGYPMKTVLLSITFALFAIAAQAGEVKATATSGKEKAACCSQAQAQAKTCEAGGCCSMKTTARDTSVKQALLSPKAAGEVTRRL